MANDGLPEATKGKKAWLRSVELWSLIVGGLATIATVATFLGLQVEKHKHLDLVYRAKLSLFSPDIHTSQKISVLYDGRPINQLTKISVLIINSGPIPIEKRDLERPSLLQFDAAKARIIEAHIVQKTPSGLEASVTTEGNSLHIEHGLLNPGESFAIELLMDGDPGNALPVLDSRISGVEPSTKGFSGETRPSNLLFSRRRGTQLIGVIATTIVTAVVVVIAFYGAFETGKSLLDSGKVVASSDQLASLEARLSPQRIVRGLFDNLPDDLQASVAKAPPQEVWLDDYRSIPAQGARADDIARGIRAGLRAGLREALARGAYAALPGTLDGYVRRQIKSMSFAPETDQSAAAFIAAALSRARTIASSPLSAKARVVAAKGEILAAAFLLIVSPFLAITAGGLWQLFLGSR